MKIIEITTLSNGGHRNQIVNAPISIPEGFAVIPEDMETENFPFGEIEVKELDGIMTVTKWTAVDIPKYQPTHEEINQMIVDKIREKYDINTEFKIINLGIMNPQNEEYLIYRNYVNECISWGDTQYGFINETV